MYTQNNTEAAIRRVQDYLYEIHLYEGIDYLTERNGTYSEATQKAVASFQQKKNLPSTGIVDLRTFEELRSLCKEYKRKNEADNYLYAKSGYPLEIGSRGNDVEVLHALLRSLSMYDQNFPPIPRCAYFSEETQNAIRYVQRMFLMEENGIVDAILFERLEKELDARIAFLEKI